MARTRSLTCKELQKDGGWHEDVLVNRCKFPIGPRNTWSNLAYVLTGIGIWHVSPMGAIMVGLLGVGSGLYHGFKTWWSNRLDNAGMYAGFGSMAVWMVAPHTTYAPLAMVLLAGVMIWRFVYTEVPDNYETILMGAFSGISVIAVALNGHPLAALASLLLMGGAYICWWADQQRKFPLPKWGHAFWHFFTAAAVYLLFTNR